MYNASAKINKKNESAKKKGRKKWKTRKTSYKGVSEENGRLGGLFLLRNAIKGELQPLFRMY